MHATIQYVEPMALYLGRNYNCIVLKRRLLNALTVLLYGCLGCAGYLCPRGDKMDFWLLDKEGKLIQLVLASVDKIYKHR